MKMILMCSFRSLTSQLGVAAWCHEIRTEGIPGSIIRPVNKHVTHLMVHIELQGTLSSIKMRTSTQTGMFFLQVAGR